MTTAEGTEGCRTGGLAAAAAAAVLVVVGFVVATGDDDPTVTAGPAGTTETPTTQVSADGLLAQRVAVIEEVIAVYSEGRLDDFMGLLADDARFFRRIEPGPLEEAMVVANDQLNLAGPCEDSVAAVICPVVYRDDFHGAGGVEYRTNLSFRFNEANEITNIDEAWAASTAIPSAASAAPSRCGSPKPTPRPPPTTASPSLASTTVPGCAICPTPKTWRLRCSTSTSS